MRNIFLIGMPSSGKSTLGKLLAHQLAYQFLDLDQQIVADQQLDIPALFTRFGEAHFREVESRLLHAIPPDQRLLIATGGGTPCFFDNMEFIRHSGISIFIDVPVAELARRIRRHNQDDRPLLSGVDLEEELLKKLGQRQTFYRQATLTVSDQTKVPEILALLKPLF